jgi:hypothetical protein
MIDANERCNSKSSKLSYGTEKAYYVLVAVNNCKMTLNLKLLLSRCLFPNNLMAWLFCLGNGHLQCSFPDQIKPFFIFSAPGKYAS